LRGRLAVVLRSGRLHLRGTGLVQVTGHASTIGLGGADLDRSFVDESLGRIMGILTGRARVQSKCDRSDGDCDVFICQLFERQ
jgi:hypothetical protein